MRHFYAQLYKNLTLIYLCVLCCFAYHTMLSSIPDHVYLKEGEDLTLDCMLPVELAVVSRPQEAMAGLAGDGSSSYERASDYGSAAGNALGREEIGSMTIRTLQERTSNISCEELGVGEHEVVCYLFGVLPVKQVEVSVVEGKQLYAAGHVVGIYGATQGVLVLGSSPVEALDGSYREPAENLVFSGDYIVAVNGEPIEEKEELVQLVDEFGREPLTLSLWRGDELIDVSVKAVSVAAGDGGAADTDYMLGLWVKDDMAGIGTLTYYDEDGSFGALGHGIGDGETGSLLRIARGELYDAKILNIQKGRRGTPGELQGVVYYGKSNQIGAVVSNTDIGIYGVLEDGRMQEYCEQDDLYSVGYKQDVQLGDAVLLSNASGELCTYHIVIDSLDYSLTDRNKGICFHVDDTELLNLTGGIVQGLSGSPIIQNGRLVGAVTHVLVNEPTQGYGIFIENMLEN